MKLVDLTGYLSADRIAFFTSGEHRDAVLNQLAGLTALHRAIGDADAFRRAIFEREQLTSTGIGGIAIPHAKLPSIEDFVISVGVAPAGIDFGSQDNEPVRILVMIAAADHERAGYLKVLASVATILRDPRRRQQILDAGDAPSVLRALSAG